MLSKEIAQSIVDKMMEVVPYNINIMDTSGKIIGSGNPDRIGRTHLGAMKALEDKKEIINYKEEQNVKPGVNTPIVFRERIVGVIGITGDPKKVIQFSKIVKVTAELLITEQYSLTKYLLKEKIKEEFIYEWLYQKGEYDDSFILRGESLNIQVDKERVIIVIGGTLQSKHHKKISNILGEEEYQVNISGNRTALILSDFKNIKGKIDYILNLETEEKLRIGIGNKGVIINNSFMEAIEAIDVGSKIYPNERVITYIKTRFYNRYMERIKKSAIKDIFKEITSKNAGKELEETLITYIEWNGEKNKVADILHIHRNTLNYRLNRIEEETGLSFSNYIDLYQYIAFYIMKCFE